MRKARYTEVDGTVIEQSIWELENEANNRGFSEEDDFIDYLRDCYIADESDFKGGFSDWLDAMYEIK